MESRAVDPTINTLIMVQSAVQSDYLNRGNLRDGRVARNPKACYARMSRLL